MSTIRPGMIGVGQIAGLTAGEFSHQPRCCTSKTGHCRQNNRMLPLAPAQWTYLQCSMLRMTTCSIGLSSNSMRVKQI